MEWHSLNHSKTSAVLESMIRVADLTVLVPASETTKEIWHFWSLSKVLHSLPIRQLSKTERAIQEFLTNDSSQAFDKLVKRPLASPRYGERWGRHWLEVARYGDSKGGDEDFRNPYAWRYRDYVIQAFNSDLPYDKFIVELYEFKPRLFSTSDRQATN